MTARSLIVQSLFNDFVANGLGAEDTELRVTLQERWNANAAWASETNIEYAIWPQNDLGSIIAPTLKGTTESTDGSGEMVVNTATYFSSGATVLVAIRKQSSGPSSPAETVFALGEELITSV